MLTSRHLLIDTLTHTSIDSSKVFVNEPETTKHAFVKWFTHPYGFIMQPNWLIGTQEWIHRNHRRIQIELSLTTVGKLLSFCIWLLHFAFKILSVVSEKPVLLQYTEICHKCCLTSTVRHCGITGTDFTIQAKVVSGLRRQLWYYWGAFPLWGETQTFLFPSLRLGWVLGPNSLSLVLVWGRVKLGALL